MLVEVFILLAALAVYLIIKDKKSSNMPPGPFEWPFYGQKNVETPDNLMKLKKLYGNIVMVRTGAIRTVYIYDYKTSKDVLGRQEFSTRPSYLVNLMADEQKAGGVAMSNGTQWQHDRRFMIRNLRNFGMGKTYLEGAMNLEAQALVEDLKKYDSQPIHYPNSIRTAPLNVIWQMMAGKRYDLRSTEVSAVFDATRELFSNVGYMTEFYFPVIKWMPSFVRRMFVKPDIMEEFSKSLRFIVERSISEHESSFDPNNLRDLIDEYVLEWKAAQKTGQDHLFRKGALCQIVADGFDAGSDTIHQALRWIIFLLAKYPNVAKQLHAKVDEVLPRDKFVSLKDKLDVPLIESFITEVLRFSSFMIVSFERSAKEDTTINGYSIQKDTVIKVVNYAIHNDPAIFEAPHEFRPDRFVSQDGVYLVPKEGLFPFGAGRRACPGEMLARSELFLFTVAILQNFDITLPEGTAFVDKLDEGGAFGLRTPCDQKLVYKSRK